MNLDPIYHTKLLELRSMKDFAAICQFLHMFHPAFALEDFETEDLEQALVDPGSLAYLIDLQARMLRTLTQDRRISFDNWIKYAQKEFENRAQEQNPWLEEDAYNYEGFSLSTKLVILGNLCEWQLDDPERFRLNFKEDEEIAVEWRVDPIGRDSLDRIYWLFDDNRLYRENPPPRKNTKSTKQSPASAKPKPAPPVPATRRGTRRSTRGQKQEDSPESEPEPEFETPPITPGIEWEPVCISQIDWEEFANLFQRSKNADEKALHALINNDILPKVLGDFKEKEKEREKLEAIANRKRSSRIVVKELEHQEKARLDAIRQQEQQTAVEQRRKELQERRAERERQQQLQVRDNRLKEREKRLKAREEAIWQREAKKKQQILKIGKEREERNKRRQDGHLPEHSGSETADHHEEEEEEEEDWVFDCVCGVNGSNLDDGELMIACGKCNVWQHVACLKQEDAANGRSAKDWETVDFICPKCIIKEQKKAARKAKKEQKLKMEAQAAANGNTSGSTPVKETKKVYKTKKTPQSQKAPKKQLTNGQYPHASSQYSSTYFDQSFQTPVQPYHNNALYHPSSGTTQSSATYYNGHPPSQQSQSRTQYPYQNSSLQHPSQYFSQQVHSQPQQFRQSYQSHPPPAPAPPAHYTSQGIPQSYQSYGAPSMGSTQSQVPYTHHTSPPLQHHYPIQTDYISSRQQSSYSSNVGSYPQQYKSDVSAYQPNSIPSGYSSQGGMGPTSIVQKRMNPMEDEMEGVERPPKIAHNHQ
ncbi:hypothetical protein BGZ76_009836 [Entomortierella beljakovae]|nr:hypothetical protein BGZ76_009836 [Entomortierella beljakovae]